MNIILAFIVGSAIGSFCNVVIYRLRHGGSPWRGRSLCPHCRHPLVTRDLIPLFSFFFLGGRCRYCQKKISWQYPLVELAMGALTSLMVSRYDQSLTAFVGVTVAAFLLIIFVYDLRYQLILDRVSIPAFFTAGIGSLLIGRTIGSISLAAAVGAGFFLLQYVVSNGRWIGGGDIRLGGVLGAALGWPLVAVSIILAYFSGAVAAVFLLASRRKTLSNMIPFGTFLSFAGVITFLWGSEILDWYLRGAFFDWFYQVFLV